MSARKQADIYSHLHLPPAFPGAVDALRFMLFSRGGVRQYMALSIKN